MSPQAETDTSFTGRAAHRPLLETRRLSVDFGGLHALEDLDMAVFEGEIVSVIGPERRGQDHVVQRHNRRPWTLVRGRHPLRGSSLCLGLDPNRVTARGIARTFQNVRLFANMTVDRERDGLPALPHAPARSRRTVLHAGVPARGGRDPTESREDTRASSAPGWSGIAWTSPPSRCRTPTAVRLEIARAMATQPRLILLDEPVAGMNPVGVGRADRTDRHGCATSGASP